MCDVGLRETNLVKYSLFSIQFYQGIIRVLKLIFLFKFSFQHKGKTMVNHVLLLLKESPQSLLLRFLRSFDQ